ncbi:polysaccharide pyruvyl transferase family protein, partial [Cyclobacterium qasimii]
MKIGIITYQRSHNYGAVLQAYALLSTLKKNGHDVEIVDYWPHYRDGMYDNLKYKFLPNDISVIDKTKTIVTDFLSYERRIRRSKKFENFIKSRLKLTGDTIKNGVDIVDKFDLIIYGSDQIWRYNNYNLFKGFDPVYWGKFPINCPKKITYAASMGVMDIDDSKLTFVKENLSNFDNISVRESSLKDLIQPLTDKKIDQVLDPVFLLSKNEWNELTFKSKINRKYVLFYNLLSSKEGTLMADTIALKLGCKVIEISGNIQPLKYSNRFQQTTGPKEYVNLFKNAEFIVSTSFHGVAFSIVFDKQFYALGMGKNSSRVQSLLDK